MAVSFYTEGIEMPDINKSEIRNWVKKVAELHSKRLGPVSYIFCDDNKILEVNKQFLQHDYYTDIITLITLKAIRFRAICLLVLILYVPMPSSSDRITIPSFIVSLFTESFIFAESTTKVLGKER